MSPNTGRHPIHFPTPCTSTTSLQHPSQTPNAHWIRVQKTNHCERTTTHRLLHVQAHQELRRVIVPKTTDLRCSLDLFVYHPEAPCKNPNPSHPTKHPVYPPAIKHTLHLSRQTHILSHVSPETISVPFCTVKESPSTNSPFDPSHNFTAPSLLSRPSPAPHP